MPDPDQIKGALSSMFGSFTSGATSKYLVYVGYAVYAGILLGIGFLIYYVIKYKYKITIFEGSITKDENGKFTFIPRKVTRDRAMPSIENGIERWKLLMNFGKTIEPISFKYILPGNNVFLYKTGTDAFNPMPILGGNPSASFSVDPFDRAFLNLGVQNDAREYQKDDAAQKAQMWMFVSGLIILVAIVLAGWLILKYSASTAQKIEIAGNALKGIASQVAPN